MQINYIELLINAILASFGGLVKRMAEIDKSPDKKASVSYYIFGSFISMFVGIVYMMLMGRMAGFVDTVFQEIMKRGFI